METSIVTVKGQIVIPVVLRRKVGIKEGTKVFLEEKDGDIIIHPATSHFYDRAYGVLKGSNLVKTLEQERQKEKEHERRKAG